MRWLGFALAAVALKTAFYAHQKRLLDDDAGALATATVPSVFGVVLLGPVAAWSVATGRVSVAPTDLAVTVGIGAVELVAFVGYLRALATVDLSVADPIKKLKPVLVGLAEPLVFVVDYRLGLLVAAVVASAGAAVVLWEGDLASVGRRLRSPGIRLVGGVTALSAVLSLGSRFGATSLSPVVFGAVVYAVMAVGYLSLGRWRSAALPAPRRLLARPFLTLGLLGVGRSVAVWSAYAHATATAVSVVTQFTVVTNVLVGGTLLKERGLVRRLVGASLVGAGALLAAL